MSCHQSRASRLQLSSHNGRLIAIFISYLAQHAAEAHPFPTSAIATPSSTTPSTPSSAFTSDEHRQKLTSHHHALKTTSATKTFAIIFVCVCFLSCLGLSLAYRFGLFARCCCLSRVDKVAERRRVQRRQEERQREARRREELESQSRTDDVVSKWRHEQQMAGGQGPMGVSPSGDIADEELPSYGNAVGDGHIATRGSA